MLVEPFKSDIFKSNLGSIRYYDSNGLTIDKDEMHYSYTITLGETSYKAVFWGSGLEIYQIQPPYTIKWNDALRGKKFNMFKSIFKLTGMYNIT